MKKISLLLLSLALIITSCKKETMPEKNKTLPFYIGNYVILNSGVFPNVRVEIGEDTIKFYETDHTHYKGRLWRESKYTVSPVKLERYSPRATQEEKYMMTIEDPMPIGLRVDRMVITEVNQQGKNHFIAIVNTDPFQGYYMECVKAYN